MTRGLFAALLLVAGLLMIAGCGGDDEDEPADPPAEVSETDEEDEREPPEGAERAERACRDVVDRAPLPEDVERDLIRDCEGLAEGDPETIRRVTTSVCRAVARYTVPFPLRGPAAAAPPRAAPPPGGGAGGGRPGGRRGGGRR
jgi:hypothetical protein